MYLTIRRYKKMLLDSDRYEAVINYGKDAINKLNENELTRQPLRTEREVYLYTFETERIV